MTSRKILRRRAVCEMSGISTSSIDRAEAAGEFPVRVVLSVRAVGWYQDEIQAWIDSRSRGPAAAPKEAIKARSAA